MEYGTMWWWLMVLMIFLLLRDRRRGYAWRGHVQVDRREVAELRTLVESQREYIEELEGRLARVEDGLDFTERLLAERTAG
jgi:hypothetical protein